MTKTRGGLSASKIVVLNCKTHRGFSNSSPEITLQNPVYFVRPIIYVQQFQNHFRIRRNQCFHFAHGFEPNAIGIMWHVITFAFRITDGQRKHHQTVIENGLRQFLLCHCQNGPFTTFSVSNSPSSWLSCALECLIRAASIALAPSPNNEPCLILAIS